jgi:hypothetical protein
MLRERMIEEKNYQMAMQQFLSQAPKMLKEPGAKYPGREGRHGRYHLR